MLPFSYAVRNLWRRRTRTSLTLLGIALITTLVILMGGFAQGLASTASTAAAQDVIVLTGSAGEHDLVRSVIPRGKAEAAAASMPGVFSVDGRRAVSIELHIATRKDHMVGSLRGVTPEAFLVHRRITLVEGREPTGPYELLTGRLAESRMGLPEGTLDVGRTEMWGRLQDVSNATARTDVSAVSARLQDPEQMDRVGLWIQRNAVTYEVAAVPQTKLFETLQNALDPIANLARIMALLVLVGGVFACANTMFAAVLARTRERGTLRALGYGPVAVGFSLLQEALLLGLVGGLLGFWVAGLFGEVPLKFPMGAFYLDLSPTVRLIGLGTALLAGFLGGIVPALRAVRMPLTDALGGKL